MKHVKHMLVAVLTVFLAAVLAVPAFAEGETKGSITIDNATKGITYTAYKLFDATYDGAKVSYKVPSGKKDYLPTTGENALFGISSAADSDGNYSFWVLDGVSDSDVIDWVKANYSTFAGSAITGAWDDESTYVFSNLDFGYYYVTSSLGTVVTIDSAVPNATVHDKNDSTPESPDKEIVAEDATALTPAKMNAAGVGSTESFEVTFNAVNWITSTDNQGNVTTTQAKTWKFTDTPTGLQIDANTVRVYVTDNGTEKEITSTITDKAVDATTGVLSFNIPWIDADGNSLYQPKVASASETQTAKIPVRVTYDATILASAATAVAPNEVEVKYTNSNDQDVSIGTDDTDTYTYKFELQKTDQDSKDLAGAKFELYKGSVAAENKVKFSVTDGVYTVDPEGTVTEIDLTTVSHALIQGLDQADYVLHETVTPKGYNQAADQPVASTDLTRVDGTITNKVNTTVGDEGVVNVVNRQGAELPSTGGMGTTILYTVGGIMVIAGIVMFLTKRRMASIEK